jgi:hypothetical protein
MAEIEGRKTVSYDVSAEVTFDIDPSIDIAHWFDTSDGNAVKRHRMEGIYPDIVTEEQLLKHLAYNAIFNGVTDASQLDGWGDLSRGQLVMRVSGSIED